MSHPFRESAAAVADRAFAQWGETAVYTPPSGAPVTTVAIVKTADVIALDPRARARQTGRKLELKTQDVPQRPVKGATVDIDGLTYTILEDAKSEDAFSLVWVCRVSVFRGRRLALSLTLPPPLLVASAALGERPNEAGLGYTLEGVTTFATAVAPIAAIVTAQLSVPSVVATAMQTSAGSAFLDVALAPPAVTASAIAPDGASLNLSLPVPSLAAVAQLALATQDAFTLAPPALVASAAAGVSASLVLTLGVPAASAAASAALAAASSVTLATPSLSAHAQQATGPTAEVNITLPAPGCSASAVAAIGASLAASLSAPSVTADAIAGLAPYTGVTLENPALAATAATGAAASLSLTLEPPSLTTAAALSIATTNALTLAAPSVSTSATVAEAASLALTLAAPSVSATATALVAPAATPNVPAPSVSAAATSAVNAAASINLAATGVTATATVSAGAAAPAIVRNTGKKSGANVSSVAGSFAALPAVNNYVIVCISGWNLATFGVTSVTDNQGNTYTRAGTQPTSSGLCRSDIWYAKVATSSGTFTITVNAASGSYIEWVGAEVSGLAATTPFDVGAQANADTGDASVGPTATLAQANEIVFAVAAVSNDDTNVTLTTPSGYTNLAINQDANATIGFEASYKIVSATTAVSASWSHDNTSQAGWVAKIATFKAA